MIAAHHQQAREWITQKFMKEPGVLALLLSGSIQHGFQTDASDVDFNVIVTDEVYRQKSAAHALTYWEPAEQFYPGGYFDGKFFPLSYLDQVAEQGNEPTRFALSDAKVAFDRTGLVAGKLSLIRDYPAKGLEEKKLRFLAQLYAWEWYAREALKRQNRYLLETAVTRMILFGGRLILADNRRFFPYHKWFLRVLEGAPDKPEGLLVGIDALLAEKSPENITRFFELVLNHKDWAQGRAFSWSAHFVNDVEINWMGGHEFIENL